MGVASKFLMLLSTPFPLLHPRCYAYRLTRHSRLGLVASLSSATSLPCHRFCEPLPVYPRRQRASFSLRAAEEFHTGTATRVDLEQLPGSANTVNSWPEWSRFVEHVTTGACGGGQGTFLSSVAVSDGDDDDSFVASFDLPEDFARAAEACLAFARERPVLLKLLSKSNVEVLVDNGSPFLFKNGLNSSRRMASYLSNAGFRLSETGAAQTVDLMQYLLSYSYNRLVTSEVDKLSASKLVEISVNDLLDDMVNSSSPVRDSHVSMSSFEQISRSPSQYFEMKRGDWICPNCTYMNFARNMKCLKCDEGRPKRQLTGGDWECPQCSFYNYGKNLACIRCDCMRPMSSPHKLNPGYMREPDLEQICRQGSSSTTGVERPLPNKDEKAERWFDNVVEPKNSVLSSVVADEYLPEIMPSQDDPKRLANMTKRFGPQADRSETSSVNVSGKGLDSSITRSLENLLDQSSQTSGSVNTSQKKDSGSVPFVPLPPAMFKNIQSSSTQEKHLENGANSAKTDPRNVPSKRPQGGNHSSAPRYESSHNFNNEKQMFSVSGKLSEPDDKKQTSNDDFPEIMPIRKGENRFVVSRKKDRSLTSPQYKKRLAMEQASGSNFVPFVPFPPGYFARKDNQGGDGAPTSSETVNTVTRKSDASKARDTPGVAELDATQRTHKSWNSESSGRNYSIDSQMNPPTGGFNSSPRIDSNQMRTGASSQVGGSPVGAANSNTLWSNNDHRTNVTGVDYSSRDYADKESTSSWSRNEVNQNSGFLGKNQPNDTPASAKPNSSWNSHEQSSRNGYSSWNNSNTNTDGKATPSLGYTGKSLEGSAVPQEPDPLDMSEEAKAQRWFRRVAQITDISELSKIPDEDFPEIMPMRKGVNRFVVSKRKTPLERRLTSPQYRRNLPIVSSDPAKDPNQKF